MKSFIWRDQHFSSHYRRFTICVYNILVTKFPNLNKKILTIVCRRKVLASFIQPLSIGILNTVHLQLSVQS